MDEGTATVIAALIGATASVAVAWISTRPQVTPAKQSPVTAENDTLRKEPKIDITPPRPYLGTAGKPINRSLLVISRFVLWILYIVDLFWIFITLSLIRDAITGEGVQNAGGGSILSFVITIFFLAVTHYFRKRVSATTI